MVKLGGLAVGAVALIAAIAFAVKKFANRKLPDVEKVLSTLRIFTSQGVHWSGACSVAQQQTPAVFLVHR